MASELIEVPLEDAPDVPNFYDLGGIALGFDVLDKPGEDEVALVIILPAPSESLGVVITAEGALALAGALAEAARSAAGL